MKIKLEYTKSNKLKFYPDYILYNLMKWNDEMLCFDRGWDSMVWDCRLNKVNLRTLKEKEV